MLSLDECRKIDPEIGDLSDEEMLDVRDRLYEIAQLAFDTRPAKSLTPPPCQQEDPTPYRLIGLWPVHQK
jgi:hypothetical protein